MRRKVAIGDTEARMAFLGGQVLSQVLVTNYCVRSVCVCVCVLLVWYLLTRPILVPR